MFMGGTRGVGEVILNITTYPKAKGWSKNP